MGQLHLVAVALLLKKKCELLGRLSIESANPAVRMPPTDANILDATHLFAAFRSKHGVHLNPFCHPALASHGFG